MSSIVWCLHISNSIKVRTQQCICHTCSHACTARFAVHSQPEKPSLKIASLLTYLQFPILVCFQPTVLLSRDSGKLASTELYLCRHSNNRRTWRE